MILAISAAIFEKRFTRGAEGQTNVELGLRFNPSKKVIFAGRRQRLGEIIHGMLPQVSRFQV
jgi:hypothetical protein